MNFHLQFPIPSFSKKINYTHSSLFVGSCFASTIGAVMKDHKFNILVNPHGILYNPSSIAVALRRYLKNDLLKESDLFFANDCWNSWEHHSCFSNTDKAECLIDININIAEAHDALKNAEWLFITLGSAFVYKRNDLLVGNCHKQPQKEFSKQILSSSEIVKEYKQLVEELRTFNPKLKIVFTISPVRYIRDGVVENNISKARLIDSVHQLLNESVYYFPAYELVIDDLRDYRFYKEDLVHPNELAIKYVFERFAKSFFDDKTIELFEKIKEINTAKQHRPFNSDTAAHKKFKKTYLDRCKKLQTEYSFLNLSEELNFFEESLFPLLIQGEGLGERS